MLKIFKNLISKIRDVLPKNKFQTVLLLCFSCCIMASCIESDSIFDKNVEIPDAKWVASDKAILKLDVSDTVSQHNFYINVRNTEAYPYRNLYLFVKTIFPNKKTRKDTVGIVLADKTGRWLGSGSGFLSSSQHLTNTILYQYNRRFPIPGEYRFEIEQAMRTDTLVGIQNIGLKIDRVNPKK